MNNDPKYLRAVELADAGETNVSINRQLVAAYGVGISPTRLAEIRASKPERDVAAKRLAAAELRILKRDLVRRMLLEGKSGYACQQECKRTFGSTVGHEIVVAVRAELSESGALTDSRAITPVALPSEMYTDPEELLDPVEPEEPEESGTDIVVSAPGPNGTLVNMKAVLAWMDDIDAVELTLTREGKLSVLARHEFDLGGMA